MSAKKNIPGTILYRLRQSWPSALIILLGSAALLIACLAYQRAGKNAEALTALENLHNDLAAELSRQTTSLNQLRETSQAMAADFETALAAGGARPRTRFGY